MTTEVQQSSGQTILVLEDEALILMDMELTLAAEGFQVKAITTVAEALHLLAVSGVDFALLDTNLSDGNSFDVARELLGRGIPFAFCTGSSSGVPADLGHVHVLSKPFSDIGLLRHVRQMLSAS